MPALFRSLARTAAPGLLFFLAACQPSPVATVNGQAITRAELDAQANVFKGGPDEAALRRQALDQLIQRALLVQAARREGLDKDPALKAQVQRQAQAARAQLERTLHEAQRRLKGLDEAVEDQALIEALSNQERPGLTVTAAELKRAYALRAQRQSLPPFPTVRDQLMDQLIIERLAERERSRADIRIQGQP